MVGVIVGSFELDDLCEPLFCLRPLPLLHVALAEIEPVGGEGMRVHCVGLLEVANGFLVAGIGDGADHTGSLSLQPWQRGHLETPEPWRGKGKRERQEYPSKIIILLFIPSSKEIGDKWLLWIQFHGFLKIMKTMNHNYCCVISIVLCLSGLT